MPTDFLVRLWLPLNFWFIITSSFRGMLEFPLKREEWRNHSGSPKNGISDLIGFHDSHIPTFQWAGLFAKSTSQEIIPASIRVGSFALELYCRTNPHDGSEPCIQAEFCYGGDLLNPPLMRRAQKQQSKKKSAKKKSLLSQVSKNWLVLEKLWSGRSASSSIIPHVGQSKWW